jgi:hypothetical protein
LVCKKKNWILHPVCDVRVLLFFDFVLLDLTTLFSSCTVLVFPPASTAAKAIIFFEQWPSGEVFIHS